jgi:hypothetical protein
MSKPIPNPTRLSRLPASEDTLGVGRLFRNGRELPDEELPRLRWRLRTSQQLRAIRPRLFLKVAIPVGVAFFIGGVVGAGVWPYWPKKESVVVASGAPAAAPGARKGKARPVATATTPPAQSEPIPEATLPATPDSRPITDTPKPAPPPVKRRAAVHIALQESPTPTPATPTLAPEVAPPSAIAVEQALLGEAMRVLRVGHDARTALALITEHSERFPQGALHAEETMLRIEALLALGRGDEALSVLDKTTLASLPNRDQQLVVRGELRAAHGRWREAREDFDEVLRERSLPAAHAKLRSLQERALWGRASARSRLGEQPGARADLDLYLRHFPGGRFAGAAASLVKDLP